MAEAARKQVRLALEGFRGIISSDNIQGIEIVDERGFLKRLCRFTEVILMRSCGTWSQFQRRRM